MSLLISAAELYTPFHRLALGAVLLEGGQIAAVGSPAALADAAPQAERIHLPAARLIPGLIDLHIHGAGGHEALGEGLAPLCRLLPAYGVTGFTPTTYPVRPATFLNELDAAAALMENPPAEGALPLGFHLEGPFLSPRKPGMAARDLFVPPSWESFAPLYEAARKRVSLITLAPEEGDGLGLIPRLRERGVVPSLGHSDADFETVRRAVELGLNHATHTFNAMGALGHRQPGTVGAVLHFPQITAQLVGDGFHVHPAVMGLLVRAKGVDRVCLVSDAQPFAGLPPGQYQWGPYQLTLDGQTSRLPDGTLASSIQLPNQMLRVLVEQVGLSFGEAAATASDTPARVLGLKKGRLARGYDADLTALDADYRPLLTMVGGRVVYRSTDS